MNSAGGNLRVAMAAIIAMIVYGSLYPFAFHMVVDGDGPFYALFSGWNKIPGRGDFVSNILLYMPLGFVGTITVGKRAGLRKLATAVLIGAGLSCSMELLQYYDLGRDTEATDLYANTLGSALGACVGWLFGQDFRWPLLREISANRLPALLVVAWLGYRLYPYEPTIDLHKYWNALKPVFLHPHLAWYSLFRHAAVWLAICVLIEKIVGDQRASGLIKRFAGFLLFSCILVISTRITLSQLVGMGSAFAIWTVLRTARSRVVVATAFMGIYVIVFRLEPFQFSDAPAHFGWMPFLSFMHGSIDTDVQAFFEKFFLYGSLIWLLAQTGVAIRSASLLATAVLLVTSGIEAFMPGRSAEITDAILAFAIGEFIRAVEFSLPEPTRYRRFLFIRTPADTLSRRLMLVDPIDEMIQPAE